MTEAKKIFISTVECLKTQNLSGKDIVRELQHLNNLDVNQIQEFEEASGVKIVDFVVILRRLLVHNSETIRTYTLKTLKNYVVNERVAKAIQRTNTNYLVSRSLENGSFQERKEAIRLVATLAEKQFRYLSPCLIMSLWALAVQNSENNKNLNLNISRKVIQRVEADTMKPPLSPHNQEGTKSLAKYAVQVIMIISVKNPALVSQNGSLMVLFNGLLDTNLAPLHQDILNIILYLLDSADLRKHVSHHFVSNMMAPLMATYYNPKQIGIVQLEFCSYALVCLLKSWAGMIVLVSHPFGVKAVIKLLSLRNFGIITHLIGKFYEIFRIKLPQGDPTAKHNIVELSNKDIIGVINSLSSFSSPFSGVVGPKRLNLLNSYIGVLLVAFIDCGLVDALLELRNDLSDLASTDDYKVEETPLVIAVTYLLAEILYLSNSLLPPRQCAALHQLAVVVRQSVSHENPILRARALTIVSLMEKFAHTKTKPSLNFHLSLLVGSNRPVWVERRLVRIQEVRRKIDSKMDEETLMQMLKNSGTLSQKEYKLWKWEIINELLEGPLQNITLFRYAQKTKFFSRLLSFFQPSNRLFSEVGLLAYPEQPMGGSSMEGPNKTTNQYTYVTYVNAACLLMEVLCTHAPLVLETSQFLVQVRDMLREEAELNRQREEREVDTDRNEMKSKIFPKKYESFLSQERLLTCCAREYFTIIGALTRYPKGQEILSEYSVFKYLKEICELETRDDLVQLILDSLDYNQEGEPRDILALILNNKNSVVRWLAVQHLLLLLRLLCSSLNKENDPKVVTEVLDILNEAAASIDDCLATIIKINPDLSKHGAAGRSLLYQYLRFPGGFEILKESGFIQKQLDEWIKTHSTTYVIDLETNLKNNVHNILLLGIEEEGSIPCHFLGELAKTEEGCLMIQEKGILRQYMNTLVANTVPGLEKRAAMWALGHITNSQYGFKKFKKESEKVVKQLINIAENSLTLSDRGTAFYVLGMVSSQPAARDIIEQCGWEANEGGSSTPVSIIAFPRHLSKSGIMKVPLEMDSTKQDSDNIIRILEEQMELHDLKGNDVHNLVYLAGKMVNRITSDTAAKIFSTYASKPQPPEDLKSAKILFQIYKLMENFKMDIKYREIVHSVFKHVDFNELFRLFDQEGENPL